MPVSVSSALHWPLPTPRPVPSSTAHPPPIYIYYISSLPTICCCSFSYCHILVLSPFFGVVQPNRVSADLSQPGIGFNSLLRSCLSSGFSLVFQGACLALGWEGRGRAPEVGGSAALQVCADRHPPPPGSKADGPPAEWKPDRWGRF